MDSKDKDELDTMFSEAESKDEGKFQKADEIMSRFKQVIEPIFTEFQQYFIEKNMTATMENAYTLNVTRGNSSFYIKCELLKDHVRLAYMVYGGGLERGCELKPEKITKEPVTDFFKKFTEYILTYN